MSKKEKDLNGRICDKCGNKTFKIFQIPFADGGIDEYASCEKCGKNVTGYVKQIRKAKEQQDQAYCCSGHR